MNSILLTTLIFLGVTVPLFVLFARLLDPQRSRLRHLTIDQEASGRTSVLPESLVQALDSHLPGGSHSNTREIEKLLRMAGYDQLLAFQEFRSIRFLLIALSVGIMALFGALVPDRLLMTVLVAGLIAVVLSYCVPRLVVEMQAKSRGHSIARGLPIAMDLMAVCLQAGLDPVNAVGKVASSLRRAYPELSGEFRRVFQIAQLHSMQTGWEQLANRVPSEEVRNLCSIMKQSERVGSDAASALIEHANGFRLQTRQRAEAQANRTSFWMLFPTITCLFVAAAIVLIGPVFHQFITGGASVQKIQELQNRSTSKVESFRGNARVFTNAAPASAGLVN